MFFVFIFLALPASTNYKLKDFGFGTGGTGASSAGSFSLEAITGEASGAKESGGGYTTEPGLIFTGQANVPIAPTFTNPSSYYNKLLLVINVSGNPSDTKFAVAISDDNFATTKYVQNDNTIGPTLGSEDYQTYSGWGSGSGILVIGLTPNTTYKVKVKAMQGKFSETQYGPIATASTINPTLTFDVDVSATDSETDPPFTVNFGDLIAGTVVDSPKKVWVDFDTNAESGGKVYVSGLNAGLWSPSKSYKIDSVTDDLDSLAKGIGAQGSSVAGGLAFAALYNKSGNNVGIIDTSVREIFTASAPVASGRASFLLKAKSSTVTPSASDYSETFTLIASGSF